MYSQLNKDGEIGIRLPKESGKLFMEKYQTTGFKSYGATMKDYVLIPEELHTNKKLLCALLEEGQAYVKSLPPK